MSSNFVPFGIPYESVQFHYDYTYILFHTVSRSTPETRSQLSPGGVAGVIIVVLFLLALSIAGVVIGIVFWVYQPWSNGWFGIETRLAAKKRYAGI